MIGELTSAFETPALAEEIELRRHIVRVAQQRRAHQDAHDAPDMSGLWVILDTTPEGRGTDGYRTLNDK